jgi:hypothetical protein
LGLSFTISGPTACEVSMVLRPAEYKRRNLLKSENSILVKSDELVDIVKLTRVALDILRIGASITVQLEMIKLFKLLNDEKGSA